MRANHVPLQAGTALLIEQISVVDRHPGRDLELAPVGAHPLEDFDRADGLEHRLHRRRANDLDVEPLQRGHHLPLQLRLTSPIRGQHDLGIGRLGHRIEHCELALLEPPRHVAAYDPVDIEKDHGEPHEYGAWISAYGALPRAGLR